MKLTETFTPEQCREARELLGGYIEFGDFILVNGDVSTVSDSPGAAACILQVAAEQVVRKAGYSFVTGSESGQIWIIGNNAHLGPFPTYLAALLAALRAVKETSDD